MYITMFMNHIRAVQSWAERHADRTSIDIKSFQMEVRARNRYYTLHPQFRARMDKRLLNVTQLTADTTGFLGWLPYRPIQWPLSTDKLDFKKYATQHGLRTPAWWDPQEDSRQDYVLKTSRGSWGIEVVGPFRAQVANSTQDRLESASDESFAEQFIEGTNLKIWVWGRTIFHVHAHPYARVTGDGSSTVNALIEQLAQSQSPRSPRPVDDARGLETCLAYQGLSRSDVPAEGQSVWLEMRYGRDYRSPATTESADNCLQQLSPKVFEQAVAAAEALESNLMGQFGAPILYSIDGVADANDDVWWLEVNSNPSLPPTGYPYIFETLFGIPVA
jgi:hypothetical protein